MESQKNNLKSELVRCKGNKEFVAKNYVEAFNLYNESICLAKPKSEMLAIAYANRSAVYFNLKECKSCLESIRLAKETGAYPANLLPKLDKRFKDCLLLQQNLDDEEDMYESNYFSELTYPANPKIPGLIKALTLNENTNTIITTQNLSAGDVIQIQECYTNLVSTELRFQRCNYCVSQNKFNLIPCDSCTNVMFCNVECYKKANENYHKIECPINDIIYQDSLTAFASRLLLKALKAFGNIDNLRQFIRTNENVEINLNEFQHDWINSSPINEYRMIYHNYNTNMPILARSLLSAFGTPPAWALHEMYLKETELKDMFVDACDKKMLLDLLLRHTYIVASVKYQVLHENGAGQFYFHFSKYLKHSCAPNCFYQYINNKRVLVVQRPIKKNQEISVSHDGCTFYESRKPRLCDLEDIYYDAKCEACTNDYPLYKDLTLKKIPTVQTYLDNLRGNNLLHDLYMCIGYQRKYDEYFPCLQLLEAEMMFKKIMNCFLPQSFERFIFEAQQK